MRGLIGCSLALALAACVEARSPAQREVEVRAPEWQAVQESLARSSRDLRVEHLEHGVRKISLQGRFRHVEVVEHAEGSSPQRACLDHPLAGR